MRMRQPLKDYSGPDLLNTLRIRFPSLEGISVAEWFVMSKGGFRVNSVIVFAILLCHVDSLNPRSVGRTST